MPRRKLSEVISYNEFFILNSILNIVTKKMTHNISIGYWYEFNKPFFITIKYNLYF